MDPGRKIMDEIEREQNLVAIFSAIRQGNTDAARNIYENSLQDAVNDMLHKVIDIILEKNGACILIGEIEQLMCDDSVCH